MALDPDDMPFTVAALCDLAGVSRQVRAKWIEKHLLSGPRSGRCGDAALYELTALAYLVSVLGFEEALVAWAQREPEWLAPPRKRRCDVVYDLEQKLAVTTGTDVEVAQAVRHGRLVRVVALGDRQQAIEAAATRLRAGLAVAA